MARMPVPVRGAYRAAAAQLLGHSREDSLRFPGGRNNVSSTIVRALQEEKGLSFI